MTRFSDLPNDVVESILGERVLTFDEVKQFLYYKCTYDGALRELLKRSSVLVDLRPQEEQDMGTRASNLRRVKYSLAELLEVFKSQRNVLAIKAFTLVMNFEHVLHILGDDLCNLRKILQGLTKKRINIIIQRKSNLDLNVLRKITDSIGSVVNDLNCEHFVRIFFNDLQSDHFREYKTVNLTTSGLNSLAVEFNDATDLTIEVSKDLKSLSASLCTMLSRLYLDASLPNNLQRLELRLCISFNYSSLRMLPHLKELIIISSEIDYKELNNMCLMSLESLHLEDNDLGDINCIPLAKMAPNLKELIVLNQDSNFRFTDVMLPSALKKLTLTNNNMEEIKGTRLSGLENLDLSKNRLKDIAVLWSDPLPHIQKLNLAYNESVIRDTCRFTNYSFSDCIFSNITELSLEGCNITDIDMERLSDMYEGRPLSSNLHTLSLSKNKLLNLRCFDSRFFSSLPLRMLDLSFNKFTYINSENFPISKASHPYIYLIDFSKNFALSRVYNLNLKHDILIVNFKHTRINNISSSIFGGKNVTIIK
ncbi:uncharacterized protein PRCAT00006325001 [Priceomyces carsonii]|uniref:uncharacterized protein n=1 Tax=Priceomyces carsonii TaxID=28549 RepID=UPI002EDA63EF|nr:unnamed protein product [Priceomyces carsonii]